MTKLTFFPLGNADTTLAELQDGRRILFDYADVATGEEGDKRCDLPKLLRDDMKQADLSSYAVVAYTHLDTDHCAGSSDFFWFEHATKYQGDDRYKIDTLWVPAAAITEEGLDDCARVIRQEARYRLKSGKGIKVFSRPERLKEWLKENGLTIESRKSCFVDAGQLVPEFSLDDDAVEFFVHSPHAKRTDDRGVVDRNGDSIMLQMRFVEEGHHTDLLITGDMPHECIGEIVDITRKKKNDDRLHWDVYHLPHHCSYKSIGPEKGENKTAPTDQVAWLCETAGEENGFIISASKPIPYKGSKEDEDVQPPHRQAANYYKEDVLADTRQFLVTMAEPSSTNPKPLVLLITRDGAVKDTSGGSSIAAGAAGVAPRAG
ncbi:hypothetical protein A3718_16280 [Erythrobacter sp. HI0019]|uniref:hypothetical protein n=1 Tax=unclassified Erythrobacter TaxID=2633097 RepID=UPI0007BA6227|nr:MULTISPECIES: hypothetical protein [unclassified Erythrobacter]KZX90375.1 hypothetical protein A3718_16280 [Erythrobacter sp. HI0019]KZY07657.1 hypothetical protein A3723_02665 [Erythrobacter sp. HI0028]